jgi:hypothetical protein
VDVLTIANLFIGHLTGGILLSLFVWLFVSELFLPRMRRRLRSSRGKLFKPSRRVGTAETVTVVSSE